MGRVAPWVKSQFEWDEIRNERHAEGTSEVTTRNETDLIPGSSTEVEQTYKWMPAQISASLGLSKVKFYSDQSQCPLFKLPLELRYSIWELAVGGNRVRVVRKINKLAHVVLPRDQKRLDEAENLAERGWANFGRPKRIKAASVVAEISLLASLQSCKRIYLEALGTLYKRNSFEFRTIESLWRFSRLSPIAGLQSVQSVTLVWSGFAYWPHFEIRTIEPSLEHIESWKAICDAIVAMKSLRMLTLVSWRDFDRRIPGHTSYEMIQKIVLPLKDLPERVTFMFALPSRDLGRRTQARLRKAGCRGIQLVNVKVYERENGH